MSSRPLRIVLADDSVLLREGVARLLSEAGFEVVGQAGRADELVRLVDELQPDVAITDIRMPPTHTDEGLRAAEAILAEHDSKVGVLVLSQYVETTFALQLVTEGRGGVGYLLKDRVADVEDFADAVRRVARGGSVIDPEVVAQLVGKRRAKGPIDDLTEREREVLALMAEGGRTRPSAIGCSSPRRRSRRTSPTSSRSSSCCRRPTITAGSSRS